MAATPNASPACPTANHPPPMPCPPKNLQILPSRSAPALTPTPAPLLLMHIPPASAQPPFLPSFDLAQITVQLKSPWNTTKPTRLTARSLQVSSFFAFLFFLSFFLFLFFSFPFTKTEKIETSWQGWSFQPTAAALGIPLMCWCCREGKLG